MQLSGWEVRTSVGGKIANAIAKVLRHNFQKMQGFVGVQTELGEALPVAEDK